MLKKTVDEQLPFERQSGFMGRLPTNMFVCMEPTLRTQQSALKRGTLSASAAVPSAGKYLQTAEEREELHFLGTTALLPSG